MSDRVPRPWIARIAVLTALGAVLALAPAGRGDDPPAADPAAKYALDTDRLIFAGVEDDAPLRGEERNPQEFEAHNVALLHARQFPAEELERHAKRGLVFKDLVADVRQDYQFKLVYFEGRLKRLRELEPTKPLAETGVKHLYEAWVFPIGGDSPMCVLMTEKPDGLKPAHEYTPAKLVKFAGYSFKLLRYESAETEARVVDGRSVERKVVRRAPLLMARTLTVLPEPDADGSAPWRGGFFPGLAALVGGIVAVILGLTWYFARGDREIRAHRDARRERNPFTDSH